MEGSSMRHPRSRERGFTLVEVMICAGLLAGAAASAAWLVARAVEDGERARLRTAGTIAAVQKMEQLRSLAWDDATDTVTDLAGDTPTTGGPGLLPSPAGTLDANVPPYVDYLSGDGLRLEAAAEAALARRWAIATHPLDPDLLVFHVVVTRARGPASRSAAGSGPFDIELVSFRARHQP
jgi:prepilin-type N-terminal cleavage/methylation domain-containing protein